MATTNNKKKKAIVAGVTAAAILLAGTFAWTSISQTAKNEAVVDINPGARLHDDFDGINKDVYVENFGDEETGVDIYARVRLDEYMEVGQEAGTNKDDADRKALPVVEGTDINDKESWTTFIYGDETQQRAYAKYWTWDMGNAESHRPYYMPTFNKNKDSLEPDINGTYEGLNAGDIVHYDDYVPYDADSSITADAVYDWDLNTIDEVEEGSPVITTDETTPLDEANVLQKSETHDAQQITSGATIMTMEEWKALPEDQQVGPYWVYDTDGWAYWAQPIAPGETTGLLLDGIHMSRVPDDNWYYGINVTGQFVTSADMSAFTKDGETITDDALDLFGTVTKMGNTITIDGLDTISIGASTTYNAVLKKAGVLAEHQPAINWSVTGGNGKSTINSSGVLKIDASETNNTVLTVTATSAEDNSVVGTYQVTALTWHEHLKVANYGEKIYADGKYWWVISKENDRALVLAAESSRKVFSAEKDGSPYGTNVWRDSDVRAYLNGSYRDSLTQMKPYILESEIYTASKADRRAADMEYISTMDYVFLLSEADIAGTFNGYNGEGYKGQATDPREYTTGTVEIIVTAEMRLNNTFLRTPHIIRKDGGWQEFVALWYNNEVYRARASNNRNICPAMWIDLTE